jgi:hypothetical protein
MVMTPKEKSSQLIVNYQLKCKSLDYNEAKQCALIAVDDIIESSPSLPILGDGGTFGEYIELSKAYWQEVKNEINLL